MADASSFLRRFAAPCAIVSDAKKMFAVRISASTPPSPSTPSAPGPVTFVDRTREHRVNRDEFIAAIQRRLQVEIGDVPLAGATNVLAAMTAESESAIAPGRGPLRHAPPAFSIRKLGFTVVLQMPEPELVAALPDAGPAAPKRKRNAKHPQAPPLTPAPRLGAVLVEPSNALPVSDSSHAAALAARMPQVKPGMVRASAYYMNNRKNFLEFINALFQPKYGAAAALDAEDAGDIDCAALTSGTGSGSSKRKPFQMLTHQKIVRDYLSIYSPYRGLLLFHGLGSGKTCSSIAIAEGLKTHKRVIVMTPASLEANYIEELKKCGDEMYKRNQFWEFLSLDDAPRSGSGSGGESDKVKYEKALMAMLGFRADSTFIRDRGGAWFVNVKKPSNYAELSAEERARLDEQITEMIRNKYQFIHYNGLRRDGLLRLKRLYGVDNLFDDCVVIVDEAHNLVGRIANKLKVKSKSSDASLSMQVYRDLLGAKNAKVVMLTGTPIINYPNEIGIMFNILRGYIKTWNFALNTSGAATKKRIDKTYFQTLFRSDAFAYDYLEYKQNPPTLSLTRNPFGFITSASASASASYAGVSRSMEHGGALTDDQFKDEVIRVLTESGFTATVTTDSFLALPDTMDEFNELFIEPGGTNVKNSMLLTRRIMGLTSYFRSAQEKLMPRYDADRGDFQKIEIEMSDWQFEAYKAIRLEERKQESDAKKRRGRPAAVKDVVGEVYKDAASSYRIFSRACCNFAFPKDLPRPKPASSVDPVDGADDADDAVDAGDAGNPGEAVGVKKQKSKRDVNAAIMRKITEELIEGRASEIPRSNAKDDGDDGGDNSDDDGSDAEGVGAAGDAVTSPGRKTARQASGSYEHMLQRTLAKLETDASQYLTREHLRMYSPKFLHVFDNIDRPEFRGLHLLYSQFRTLEGIGIFRLVLEANGYVQFKVANTRQDGWTQVLDPADADKPMYALYTGTETVEEKEIVRNVYNGTWDNLPSGLRDKLVTKYGSEKNKYGAVIKLLMITASGAEGINLRNVRFVHIMEPYWHPVRTEQIIGRANRICSHVDLPEEERTVNVFLYVMKFTKTQIGLGDRAAIEVVKRDVSKLDSTVPFSTDESLYEISQIKERVNRQLLTVVKSSAMDCALHKRPGSKEQIECFSYSLGASGNEYGYVPNVANEPNDRIAKQNIEKKKLFVLTDRFNYDKETGDVYEGSTVVGKLEKNEDGTAYIVFTKQ
jgi:hypothetical protein